MENSSLENLMNISYNATSLDIETETVSQALFEKIFYFSVIAVSSPANLIVIICLWEDSGSHTIGFNTYAVSVAFTDLLVGAVLLPVYTFITVFPSWPLGNAICLVVLIVDYGLTSVSMLLFLAMGYDRYRCVTAPIQYRCNFKRIRVVRTCLVVWCLGFVVWIPYILIKKSGPGFATGCTSPTLAFTVSYFDIIQVCVAHYIPIAALIFMNTALVWTLNTQQPVGQSGSYKPRISMSVSTVESHSAGNTSASFSSDSHRPAVHDSGIFTDLETKDSMDSQTQDSTTTSKSAENLQKKHGDDRKKRRPRKRNTATHKIVGMIVTFLIFWLPYCITWPLNGVCPTCLPDNVSLVFYVLPFGQSAANPLIVILTSPNIRSKLSSFCSRD